MADKKDKGKEGKDGKKLLLVAIAAIVLAAGAGVGGYLLGTRSAGEQGQSVSSAPEAEETAAKAADAIGPLVEMEDFIVNLLDEKESRYLKAAITLELSGPAVQTEIQSRMPQVRDAILLLIGSKTLAELWDLQGKLQLRAELVGRINKLLRTGKVRKLYFTDFVIQ